MDKREQIGALKRELVDGGRAPEEIIKDIRRLEDELLVEQVEASRREADRLKALIEQARAPVAGWQAELDEAYPAADQAALAAEEARKAQEAATRRVQQLEHLIKDAEKRVQMQEIELSRHQSESRAKYAA
jgi:hypothetical protein